MSKSKSQQNNQARKAKKAAKAAKGANPTVISSAPVNPVVETSTINGKAKSIEVVDMAVDSHIRDGNVLDHFNVKETEEGKEERIEEADTNLASKPVDRKAAIEKLKAKAAAATTVGPSGGVKAALKKKGKARKTHQPVERVKHGGPRPVPKDPVEEYFLKKEASQFSSEVDAASVDEIIQQITEDDHQHDGGFNIFKTINFPKNGDENQSDLKLDSKMEPSLTFGDVITEFSSSRTASPVTPLHNLTKSDEAKQTLKNVDLGLDEIIDEYEKAKSKSPSVEPLDLMSASTPARTLNENDNESDVPHENQNSSTHLLMHLDSPAAADMDMTSFLSSPGALPVTPSKLPAPADTVSEELITWMSRQRRPQAVQQKMVFDSAPVTPKSKLYEVEIISPYAELPSEVAGSGDSLADKMVDWTEEHQVEAETMTPSKPATGREPIPAFESECTEIGPIVPDPAWVSHNEPDLSAILEEDAEASPQDEDVEVDNVIKQDASETNSETHSDAMNVAVGMVDGQGNECAEEEHVATENTIVSNDEIGDDIPESTSEAVDEPQLLHEETNKDDPSSNSDMEEILNDTPEKNALKLAATTPEPQARINVDEPQSNNYGRPELEPEVPNEGSTHNDDSEEMSPDKLEEQCPVFAHHRTESDESSDLNAKCANNNVVPSLESEVTLDGNFTKSETEGGQNNLINGQSLELPEIVEADTPLIAAEPESPVDQQDNVETSANAETDQDEAPGPKSEEQGPPSSHLEKQGYSSKEVLPSQFVEFRHHSAFSDYDMTSRIDQWNAGLNTPDGSDSSGSRKPPQEDDQVPIPVQEQNHPMNLTTEQLAYIHRRTFIGVASLEDFLNMLDMDNEHMVTKANIINAFIDLVIDEQNEFCGEMESPALFISGNRKEYHTKIRPQCQLMLGTLTLRKFLKFMRFKNDKVYAVDLVKGFEDAARYDRGNEARAESKATEFQDFLSTQTGQPVGPNIIPSQHFPFGI